MSKYLVNIPFSLSSLCLSPILESDSHKKENRTKIIAGGELELIQQQLSDIRKQLQDVRNAPKDRYNAQQKRAKIEQLLKDQGNNFKRIRQMRDDIYGVKMQAPTYDKTLPAN